VHGQPAGGDADLSLTPALRWFVFLWFVGYALCAASCAHRYQKHQTATRTEETRKEWRTEQTAAETTQSVATETKTGSRRTRRWAPDGKLLEEIQEHWGSDGRVQVSASASASQSASGVDFSNVVAGSSTSVQADTRAGWSWWWALLAVPVVGVAWGLRRWIRSRISFLG
jgi:hypothetical protein